MKNGRPSTGAHLESLVGEGGFRQSSGGKGVLESLVGGSGFQKVQRGKGGSGSKKS